MKEAREPLEAYAETVGARKALIKAAGSKFPGDPRRVADAVVRVSEFDGLNGNYKRCQGEEISSEA